MYKTTYMRDYGEKCDIPKPTSPNQQKRITDIFQKHQHAGMLKMLLLFIYLFFLSNITHYFAACAN